MGANAISAVGYLQSSTLHLETSVMGYDRLRYRIKKLVWLLCALMAVFVTPSSHSQTCKVTETIFGDPDKTAADLPKGAIENRTPESRKAWVDRYRLNHTATYTLYRGTTAKGLRALYFDVPPQFDFHNVGTRRAVFWGPGGTLSTNLRGLWLENRSEGNPYTSDLAELVFSSRWMDRPTDIGTHGMLSRNYPYSVTTTFIWRIEENKMVFRQFHGADVYQKIVAIATTTLDRKSGVILFKGEGRDLNRIEYQMIDPGPKLLSSNVVKLGTKVYDVRKDVQREYMEPWNGSWPKFETRPVEVRSSRQSLAGTSIQGVAPYDWHMPCRRRIT